VEEGLLHRKRQKTPFKEFAEKRHARSPTATAAELGTVAEHISWGRAQLNIGANWPELTEINRKSRHELPIF
jgi:hypothetical protein